jgi:hypothetical protein
MEESKIWKGRREQGTGSPFSTRIEDEEMTYEEARHLRRFGNGRRPGTNNNTFTWSGPSGGEQILRGGFTP